MLAVFPTQSKSFIELPDGTPIKQCSVLVSILKLVILPSFVHFNWAAFFPVFFEMGIQRNTWVPRCFTSAAVFSAFAMPRRVAPPAVAPPSSLAMGPNWVYAPVISHCWWSVWIDSSKTLNHILVDHSDD